MIAQSMTELEIASIVPYIPKPPPSPKTRPKRSQAIKQVLVMQKRLLALVEDDEVPASAVAQCARAWDVLEDRRRVLRGKGLPKPVEPITKSRPRQPRESFIEGPGTTKPCASDATTGSVPAQPSDPQTPQAKQ